MLPLSRLVRGLISCRRGFSSRAAWACHASKKHGYRIAASLLIGRQALPLCEGCGKLFASSGRLRRHLLHSVSCRTGWGTFQPDPAQMPPRPNEAAPPLQLRGTCASYGHALDPASYSRGLLECLDSLESPCAESVWAAVVDFVEPLAILRETLRIWAQSHGFEEPFASAAEDAQLMLDPVLSCDTFSPTKPNTPVAEACNDLPGPLDTALPFVLTGASADFFLDKPPCPAFSYPYMEGLPLPPLPGKLRTSKRCATRSALLFSRLLSPESGSSQIRIPCRRLSRFRPGYCQSVSCSAMTVSVVRRTSFTLNSFLL